MILGYLDAGSGSLILQAILGGAAGLAIAFRAWKMKFSLARQRSKDGSDGDAAVDESPVSSES